MYIDMQSVYVYEVTTTTTLLLPIIREFVTPGATIYHDDWSSYRTLDKEGFSHGIVCHKYEFKSPEGVCTNTIEGIHKSV